MRLPDQCRYSGALSLALSTALLVFLLPTFPQVTSAQSKKPTDTLRTTLDRKEGGLRRSIAASGDPEPPAPFSKRIVRGGMSVDLEVTYTDPKKGRTGEFREGEDVAFRFRIKDAATGNPLSGLNPAAWLTLAANGKESDSKDCTDRVQTLLGGSLLARAELDLNTYYVLALNSDATITVVDPLFGYGGTKLLAMIQLKSPGEDWAITSDQTRLFVSMPAANQVAVIDTNSWSVAANIDVRSSPTRLALQPDGAYLWIVCEGDAKANLASGIVAVSLKTLKPVARFLSGRGPHEITFSDDSRFAFVTNRDDRTVSVIDIRKLIKTKDVRISSKACSITYSKLAQAVYASGQDDGVITVISATKHDVIARINAEPGLGQVRFAPGDRLAFVVNPSLNSVYIIDAALNRIVQRGNVEKGPDQLAFSRGLAYVRHRYSETVAMIPLNEIGTEGKPIPVLDFPGGQNALGKTTRPSLADSIIPAASDNAMLVANPADKAIYYYQEGMAAPMGNFSNYGREPRAVLVVDHSVRETTPGNYLAVARLPRADRYSLALFINSPRVVDCIDFPISSDPERASSNATEARIERLTRQTDVEPGKDIRISFRVTDASTGKPITKLKDLLALTFAAGIWQERSIAEGLGGGVYALTVAPPSPGVYRVYITSMSLKLAYTQIFTFESKNTN